MMKINSLITCYLITSAIASCSSSGSEKPSSTSKGHLDIRWAENKLWNDGKAEVAIYDAKRIIYGHSRSFDYVYVLVKETFNKEFHVKTNNYGRKDLYEVMKVNKFCRIPTHAYPYHYLTSVFFRRDRPSEMHKLTNTSQEWCGNTAKSFMKEEGEGEYTFDFISYWDGQGNGTEILLAGPWFEDQLSYTLRTLRFQEGLEFDVELYPTQVTNKADIPKPEEARISVHPSSASELDGISTELAVYSWKVQVRREQGPDLTYWFSNEYPNYLLKMESTDGRKLSLKSLDRSAYWEKE